MNDDRPRRVWWGLALWLLASYAAAAVGGLFQPGEWYVQLAKPAWTPPAWLFGPVWTALYAMMGLAAWIVWKERGFARARSELTLFIAQLVLNAAWSWIFFGLHQPGLAAAEILVLWLAIAATLVAFLRVRVAAGALLVPYLCWVTFAAALNIAIWRLNP